MSINNTNYSSDVYDYLFKIIIIGDTGVGKSSLLLRYTRNEFYRESRSTIGVELAAKYVTIDSKRIKTAIWDTAGQERFRAASNLYYRNSLAAFIVYDITNYNSFKNVTKWLIELRQHVQSNIIITLIGNKKDLRHLRAVTKDEASEFARLENMNFLETSAYDSENVEAAFRNIIEDTYHLLVEKNDQHQPRTRGISRIEPNDIQKVTKVECCKII